MDLLVGPSGVIRCIYTETLDLQRLGRLLIERASHVEPTADGQWTADLTPVDGPLLGPLPSRSAALDAEHAWLLANWLLPAKWPARVCPLT